MDITGDMISLWREAFGDTEEEISLFLSLVSEKNVITRVEDGRVVSQLFLLEGNVCDGKKSVPAYYLYAAATLSAYRGRGIMTQLIAEAAEKAKREGKGYILLLPGEEKLYGFYEKSGFRPLCKCLLCEYNGGNIILPDESEYSHFVHSENVYSYAEKLYSYPDYETIINPSGSVIYSVKDGTVTVKEWKKSPLVSEVKEKTGCDKIYVRLPLETDVNGKCTEINHGMILPLGDELPRNVYLDYTLD